MPALTRSQLQEFLTGGRHLMKLATLTAEGWPAVIPVWYHYSDGVFLIAGRRKAAWVENIRNDSRVSACIDKSDPPYVRVMVEADAVIADNAWLGDWEPWAIRYRGQESGHRYYEETKDTPRALIRLTPRKITTWGGAGWHPRYEE